MLWLTTFLIGLCKKAKHTLKSVCLILHFFSEVVSWHCCFTVCCSGLTSHKFGYVQVGIKSFPNSKYLVPCIQLEADLSVFTFCCLYSEACFQGSAPGQSFSKVLLRKKSFKKPSFDLHYLNFNVNEAVFNLSEVVTYYVQHLVDKVKKKINLLLLLQ